jgi:hypothetical protein
MTISLERAERIARAQPCVQCKEYTYRKLSVKPSNRRIAAELDVEWTASLVCGVCDTHQELGIAGDGEVVYVG